MMGGKFSLVKYLKILPIDMAKYISTVSIYEEVSEKHEFTCNCMTSYCDVITIQKFIEKVL